MANIGLSDCEVLEVFIESVDELIDSDFLTQAVEGGISTSMRWSNDGQFVEKRTGPKRDAVKAFLLTLRFFGQNNEPTSLFNMENRIDGLSVDATLKERFRTSRSNFNFYLDKPPSIGFPPNAGADSRREIFETFLYGTFAHANPKYRRQIKEWEGQPYFNVIRSQFDTILLEYIKALSVLANVCRECVKSGFA